MKMKIFFDDYGTWHVMFFSLSGEEVSSLPESSDITCTFKGNFPTKPDSVIKRVSQPMVYIKRAELPKVFKAQQAQTLSYLCQFYLASHYSLW